MVLKREDWEEVLEKCEKEYSVIVKALDNMIIAAGLQGVMFNKAVEELEKLPETKT